MPDPNLPESSDHPAVLPTRRTVLGAGLGVAATVIGGAALPLTAAAAPSAEFPWIIDCDTWGARPPAGELPLSAISTNKIILHHMAFPNVTDYSREQAIKLAKKCQDLHMDGNGWSDTGQHFTISRGGYVLEGRRGSLTQLDTGGNQVISAHCPGENGRSIGIEHEGTYVSDIPPEPCSTRRSGSARRSASSTACTPGTSSATGTSGRRSARGSSSTRSSRDCGARSRASSASPR